MLLLLTLFTLLLAWKYNERNRILDATKRIVSDGGEAFYSLQNPSVATQTRTFHSAYPPKPISEKRTLADGSIETVLKTQGYMSSAIHPVSINVIKCTGNSKTNNSILQFFSNSDVSIDSVRIPESNVDKRFVTALQNLKGLRVVQICRDPHYFRTCVGSPSRYNIDPEQKQAKLAELSKPFDDAKNLIQAKLPNVVIVDGLME